MLLRHCQTKEADKQTCIPLRPPRHISTPLRASDPRRRTHRPNIWLRSLLVNQNRKETLGIKGSSMYAVFKLQFQASDPSLDMRWCYFGVSWIAKWNFRTIRDQLFVRPSISCLRGPSQGSKFRHRSRPSLKMGWRTCSELAVRTLRSVL
jgi:hypothetical protein